MSGIAKKAKVKTKKTAPHANRQGVMVIAGVVVVVVIAGILLTTPGIFPQVEVSGSDQVAKAKQEVQEQGGYESLQASISFVNFPSAATANMPISLIWSIDSNRGLEIGHTAVHYDTKSVPSPSSAEDYAKAGRYLSGGVPDTFSDSITILQPGTYYMRAHAVIDGNDIWTDEKSFLVSLPSVQTSARKVSIEADDISFYIDDEPVSKIAAKLGERLKLNLEVRTSNVGFGGLDFKSAEFGVETGKVKPGSDVDVDVTVDKTGSITSYWPGTDREKATLQIDVV